MLDLLFGPSRPRASMDEDRGWSSNAGPLRRKTQAGVVVNEELALTYAACWCATRILSETVSGLPLFLYRHKPNGDREPATDHPCYDLVKTSPNPQMGSTAFREGRVVHQVNFGNGFAEIERARPTDPTSPIVALWPIHAGRVKPVVPGDHGYGRYSYAVKNNDGSSMLLRAEEMLHVPGAITEDGVWAKGVIAYARESLGAGIGMDRQGATCFGSGNMPRVAAKLPGLTDPEKRRQFRQEWKEIHGSPDAGEIAILPKDGELIPLSINNDDNQFLESRKFNIGDVGRWYRLPVYMLGEYEKAATYASVEIQGIEFIVYGLMPWVLRWEEQLALKLLTAEERKTLFFEHTLAGLLRGDMKSRYEAYEIGLRNGWLTLNLISRLENLPSLGPAGDQHFMPLNMTTVERTYALSLAEAKATEEVETQAEEEAEGDPGAELLDVPDYRQEFGYDCGPASVHSVCEFFGVGPATHQEYIDQLGTTPAEGTSVPSILAFLIRQGLTVTAGGDLDVEDLRRLFLAGQPVICPVQMYGTQAQEAAGRSGHYVVVIGVGLGQVFVQDPSAGRRLMSADEFLAGWFDVGADGTEYNQFGIAVGDELLKEPTNGDADNAGGDGNNPVGGKPAGDSNPDDVSGSSGGGNGSGQQAAARRVLSDVLGRLFAKEAAAARRAVAGDFDAWLSSWFVKEQPATAVALMSVTALLRSLGVEVDATAAAIAMGQESKRQLFAAYNTDTREQLANKLDAWPVLRAGQTIDTILPG